MKKINDHVTKKIDSKPSSEAEQIFNKMLDEMSLDYSVNVLNDLHDLLKNHIVNTIADTEEKLEYLTNINSKF